MQLIEEKFQKCLVMRGQRDSLYEAREIYAFACFSHFNVTAQNNNTSRHSSANM